jgi:hypothetical protein
MAVVTDVPPEETPTGVVALRAVLVAATALAFALVLVTRGRRRTVAR